MISDVYLGNIEACHVESLVLASSKLQLAELLGMLAMANYMRRSHNQRGLSEQIADMIVVLIS